MFSYSREHCIRSHDRYTLCGCASAARGLCAAARAVACLGAPDTSLGVEGFTQRSFAFASAVIHCIAAPYTCPLPQVPWGGAQLRQDQGLEGVPRVGADCGARALGCGFRPGTAYIDACTWGSCPCVGARPRTPGRDALTRPSAIAAALYIRMTGGPAMLRMVRQRACN